MSRQKSLSEIKRLLGRTYQKRYSDKQLLEIYKDYTALIDGISEQAREAMLELSKLLDDEVMQEINFDEWLGSQPEEIQIEIREVSNKMEKFKNKDEGKALKNVGWIK